MALSGEDEEEIQETMYWQLKHIPFLGFGTSFVTDNLFLLFSMLADEDEEKIAKNLKHNIRGINPLNILPEVGPEVGKAMTDKAIDAFMD